MEDKEHFQKLLSFMQEKGFIWGPEPEIYGGLSGFYTYAPLGKLLKNNVEREIRKTFVGNEFMEVECPTVMQKEVWEASGHLGNFTDPMSDCDKCKASFKIDEELKEGDKCPSCRKGVLGNSKEHNLMMKTTIGMDQEAYNRPETATTTYLPFIRYDDFYRGNYPFSVFQIGKAYRNEISPRQHVIRMREFTQAEAQMFILPEQKNKFPKFKEVSSKTLPLWTWELQKAKKGPMKIKLKDAVGKHFSSQAYAWTLALAYELFSSMGIPEERIRLRQHGPDEKAFYADDAWDIEVHTKSFGWIEMCGVHDRTDYDLKQHAKSSKKNLQTNQEGKKITPHILEIAFGTDRPTFALLDIFYDYKDEKEGKTTFRIPYRLAPVKAAVLPLMRKEELVSKARKVYEDMRKWMCSVRYDETASIGKRYLRKAQEGTPWCITIDYDTLKDDTVTVRDRDTEKQTRIKVSKLKEELEKLKLS